VKSRQIPGEKREGRNRHARLNIGEGNDLSQHNKSFQIINSLTSRDDREGAELGEKKSPLLRKKTVLLQIFWKREKNRAPLPIEIAAKKELSEPIHAGGKKEGGYGIRLFFLLRRCPIAS